MQNFLMKVKPENGIEDLAGVVRAAVKEKH